MALYKLGDKLELIKESPFRLEKEIQKITEDRLSTILKLEIVKSEFALNNFRIVVLPKNRTICLVKIKTIKLTETYEKNTTKIHF